MSPKGLEWASRTRTELLIRISGLREVLADVEPLRLELVRLEAQLKGVERLVAIYHQHLGYPAPSEVGEDPVAQDAVGQRIAPAATEIHIPSSSHVTRPTWKSIAQELLRSVSPYGKMASEALLIVRHWLVRLLRGCRQTIIATTLKARLWAAEHLPRRSA